MNQLTFRKFFETLGNFKHYQTPCVVVPDHLPLTPVNDNYSESLIKQVETGAVHPIIISRNFVEKHNLAPNSHITRVNHYLAQKDVPFEIPMPFDSIWVEFLLENEAANPMLSAAPLLAGLDANPQIYGYLLQQLKADSELAYLITAFIVVAGRKGNVREASTVRCILRKSEFKKISLHGPRDVTNVGLIWHHQLFEILNLISSEKQVGLDKTKMKFRTGTGKLRRQLTLKNIVYVIPSAERATFNEKYGAKIDWTHRWEVRGHWRTVPNIGKDPDGDYCIPGKTWVRPSVKGPDTAPLIQKTRYALPAIESP